MNFKSAYYGLLSTSLLLVLSPYAMAGKKSVQEEVRELQSALLKRKSTIDTLLNTKAHIIPKETEIAISGAGAGNYTRKAPMFSAIRQMSLETVKDGGREDLFKGPDAMANLLKGYQMTKEDKVEAVINPTEKIYSIAVLNTQNLEVMKLANDEMIKAINQSDDFLKRISRYVELTIKGERFISFKQAEDLSNTIYRMNQDIDQIEELAIKLSPKEQQVVETFRKNMNEWLNKKLVFTEINKKGFTAVVTIDSSVYLGENNYVRSMPLNKDYSAQNIANTLKMSIIQTVRDHHYQSSWDDLKLRSDDKTLHKISIKDLDNLNVSVSADRLKATISTKKFTINNTIFYPRTAKLSIMMNDKELYNHEAQNREDYYNPNISLVKAQLEIVKGYEIQMKNMYKNYGLENFGTELGKVELKLK